MNGEKLQSTGNLGLFGIVEDHVEKYQSLEGLLVRNRASTFFLSMKGDAMAPTVDEGDILVIDRSIPLTSGRVIVVAQEGELMCRRYHSREYGAWLTSDNTRYRSLPLKGDIELQLFGVVVGVARRL